MLLETCLLLTKTGGQRLPHPPPQLLLLPSIATAECNCLKTTLEKAAGYILTPIQRRHLELLFTLPLH